MRGMAWRDGRREPFVRYHGGVAYRQLAGAPRRGCGLVGMAEWLPLEIVDVEPPEVVVILDLLARVKEASE